MRFVGQFLSKISRKQHDIRFFEDWFFFEGCEKLFVLEIHDIWLHWRNCEHFVNKKCPPRKPGRATSLGLADEHVAGNFTHDVGGDTVDDGICEASDERNGLCQANRSGLA